MIAKIIVGANFGDEGKGLMTDYFGSQAKKPLVVRFNGGAQAGHTVRTPDGRRYSFSHGAGGFIGADNYLGGDVIVNPILFGKDMGFFTEKFGYTPNVLVDPSCGITFPHDMLLNQTAEYARGERRHGSCGAGAWETALRERAGVKCYIAQLGGDLEKTMDMFTPYWEKRGFKMMNGIIAEAMAAGMGLREAASIANRGTAFLEQVDTSRLTEDFFNGVDRLATGATMLPEREIATRGYDMLVFEGAQGLLLDEDNRKFMPHVSASKTGILNAIRMCRRLGIACTDMEIVYVTRAYLTRHGAGPMGRGGDYGLPPYNVSNDDNQDNEHQGSMRFGYLDMELMATTINDDIGYSAMENDGLEQPFSLAVTCMDHIQIDEIGAVVKELSWFPREEFPRELYGHVGATGGLYVSSGPTRMDVRKIL